jgi:hypothetical protein
MTCRRLSLGNLSAFANPVVHAQTLRERRPSRTHTSRKRTSSQQLGRKPAQSTCSRFMKRLANYHATLSTANNTKHIHKIANDDLAQLYLLLLPCLILTACRSAFVMSWSERGDFTLRCCRTQLKVQDEK